MTKQTTAVFLILNILQINLLHLCFSQTVIKTLPGFPGQLPFKLETGYVGLGDGEDLQMFYYFVESERNPRDDPLMIWITGGPGCSSPRTFFYYIGPLKFNYANSGRRIPQLEVNPYSWSKVANVIFVDPPGSGFTYTKSKDNYKNSDTLMAASIYEFLMKWLENHPEFLKNPLYISGVSYSGISVPVMVQNIIDGNEAGNDPNLNIKGYMIGNPLTDRNIDFNARIPYANQFALLSDELFETAKARCNGEYIEVNPAYQLCQKALAEVNKCLMYLYDQQILEPICVPDITSKSILQLWDGHSSKRNPENALPSLSQLPPDSWCREDNYQYAIAWTTDERVQKALHIREGTIDEWVMCNTDHYDINRKDTDTYSYDIASSIAYHRNLTKKNCRALIYSGDHDLVFPYIGTRKWIHTLGLSVDRTWKPWFVNKQVAGYNEIFSHDDYSLTFATVKATLLQHSSQKNAWLWSIGGCLMLFYELNYTLIQPHELRSVR
nr:PREDICTED: serine carboxypeptidase-like 17 isoform X2 [Daucus carota subsp. sativus]